MIVLVPDGTNTDHPLCGGMEWSADWCVVLACYRDPVRAQSMFPDSASSLFWKERRSVGKAASSSWSVLPGVSISTWKCCNSMYFVIFFTSLSSHNNTICNASFACIRAHYAIGRAQSIYDDRKSRSIFFARTYTMKRVCLDVPFITTSSSWLGRRSGVTDFNRHSNIAVSY